jgi:hypothetical protein
MDRDKFFQSLVAPLDADMQVKAMVASCYTRDGADLLEVFWMGWKSDRNNLSYRSKLFINLRMAIECYLKALVVSYSDKAETPEDAYKAARKGSHKLADLLAEVQTRSGWTKRYFRKASDAIIAQVDGMQVGLRYEVDMAAEFSKEPFEATLCDSGPMSGTIGSDEWMLSLHGHAAYIGKKARKAFQHKLYDHTSHLTTDADKRAKRIKLFMTNSGLL